jgi:uncharacterized membrane protein (UPF0127 family)
MKRYGILIIILVIALTVSLWAFYNRSAPEIREPVLQDSPSSSSIRFGDTIISVEIADTEEKREQGLSGREQLAADQGLLFIFDSADYYGIWMKDMLFPIDVIWFDESMKIVTIEEHMKPESYPKIFYPTEKSLYVLELPAGYAKSHNLTIGTTGIFQKKP